ncbi:MAG: hypothetical protein ACK5CE_10435 [Actinomycetes bacterium]|jgi:hypothetical protein
MNAPQDQPQGPWAPPPSPAPPGPSGPTLPPAGGPTLPPHMPVSPPSAPGAPVPGAPVPGAGLPPQPGFPPLDPTSPVVTVDGGGDGSPAGAKRSKGALVGAVVGVAALVAAGAFAVVQITGNEAEGGAASAEEVGTALTTALDDEDLLGVVDLLLPGERDAFRDPMIETIEHLVRLEVLSDGADLSKLAGFDIQFTDVTVREEPTNVDDITNVYLSGAASVSVNGDEIPLGDLLLDDLFDGERPDMDQDMESSEFEEVPLTVVERDGRWYLSAFYTIAEQARAQTDLDVPEEGMEPRGGDSPEDALDTLFAAVSDLDLEGMLAVLDPTELEAVHRYAPLFLGDAQDELDDAPIDWAITDTEYEVTGDGSRRSVAVTALTLEATIDGDDLVVEWRDECLTASAAGDELSFCVDDLRSDALADLGFDDEGLQEFLDVIEEAFSDWDPQGIAVHEVDGQWFVSPMRSYWDFYDSILTALDAEELRAIIDAGRSFADDVVDGLEDSLVLPDQFTEDDLGGVLDDPTEAFPDDMTTDVPGDDELDPLSACYMEMDAAVAIACMGDGIAAGTIDPTSVPAHYRYPECGVAELYFDRLYDTPDAEFVAAVEAASPCFLALVESGELLPWEVAGELLAPECLEGRNWYSVFDDSEYSSRFFDCTFEAQRALE